MLAQELSCFIWFLRVDRHLGSGTAFLSYVRTGPLMAGDLMAVGKSRSSRNSGGRTEAQNVLNRSRETLALHSLGCSFLSSKRNSDQHSINITGVPRHQKCSAFFQQKFKENFDFFSRHCSGIFIISSL